MQAGRELDKLVADRVMGLETNLDGHEWSIPRYSTEMVEAWKVVEHLKGKLPESTFFNLYGSQDDWSFEIDTNDGRFLQNGPTIDVVGQGSSAPHAICVVALRAMASES